MKLSTGIPGLLFLAAGCASGVGESAHEAAEPPATDTVGLVEAASLTPVHGLIEARLQAELATRHMAAITDITVEPGDSVKQGQRLVMLGQDDIAAARVRSVAAIEVAAAALPEAERHAARMDTLLAADAVSQVQRDQAQLQLTQARTGVAMAQAGAREVAAAAGYAVLSAPFSGVVVARYADPGDLASPGVPILELVSAGDRDAVLAVPPHLVEFLAPGDSLEVASQDGRRHRGEIRSLSPAADRRTRSSEVRVSIPADWPTGLSVTAMVPGRATTVLAVPEHLVVRRGQLTGVRVLTGDRVAIRWIRLGRSLTGGLVEVLSGLEPGDRVVT